MSKWVNAEVYFNPRYHTFTVSHKSILMEQILLLMGSDPKPEAVQEWCELTIERHRPELRGCQIHYMGFNQSLQAWEFTVSHNSLPEVQPGQCPESEPLIP